MSVAHELQNIRRMPYGTARTAAAETAARKIEADGPKEHLAEALLDLVEAYTFGGQGEKSFVVFARALRLWDASPELFDESDEHNLFWEFKWIASDLPDYPQITAAQATAFLDDMQRRFELQGSGLSAVLAARFGWAWQSGAHGAEQARLAWITAPRDSFDDCRACVIGRQTDFFLEQGRSVEALDLGITQEGTCNIEPTKTYHATALAALNLGNAERALHFHKLALASETRGNRDLASSRGQSFELLARGGQLERALRELRGDYRELLTDPPSPLQHLRFLLGIIAGLSAHPDRGGLGTGVTLPEAEDVAPGAATRGLRDGATAAEVTVSELHGWAAKRAREHAELFDARSGSTYYGDLLERALAASLADNELDAEAPSRRAAADEADETDETDVPAVHGGGVGPAGADAPAGDGPGGGLAARLGADARLSADAHLGRARESVARTDYGPAVRDYEHASVLLEAEGWIERAGLAAAEAAQCAALDRDEERAHALFARAVPLLRSGGTEAGALAAVLAAWAPVAARMNDAGAQIRATAAVLEAHAEWDPAGLTEELAERRRQEWARERATLRDTLARSLAATRGLKFGDALDGDRAAAEALRAGEEFAGIGLLADAAHSFWLVGKIQLDRGDTEAAVWGFESAFEGFTAARKSKERLAAAGELIDLLRHTGQLERAAAVVAEL